MRKTINLTGRRNIPTNAVGVQLIGAQPQRVRFEIAQAFHFNRFPRRAKIKLKFRENKGIETVDFGPYRCLDQATERVLTKQFSRPSCQFFVIEVGRNKRGLILGSSRKWTLSAAEPDGAGSDPRGILQFAVGNSECVWELDFPEQGFPIIYLDSSIPDAKGWAKNDPIFRGLVLPEVVRRIFGRICDTEDPTEVSWMRKWIDWAHGVYDGEFPSEHSSSVDKEQWIGHVVTGFAHKNGLLAATASQLETGRS